MSISSPQTSIDRAPSKRHPHLPSPIAAWLSSLSSVSDGASERRSPGHQRQTTDYNESTGLVQRCVVVQRDQNGFGFTVSGDRIVLVQSVRPGGAAMRAGVQEGDRIVKVNGTLVANSSHIEVVKLIKSGTYVALTLLGSPPPSMATSGYQHDVSSSVSPRNTLSSPVPPPPPLPPPQRITGPKPLQDPEVQKHASQILRNMLKQEETELQTLCEVYNRTPNPSLQEQMEGARRRVYQLQLKIRQETAGPGDILRTYSDCSSVGYKPPECRLSMDSQDGDSGLDSGTERIPSISEYSINRTSILSDLGLDSSHTSPVISTKIFQHRRQGSDTAFIPGTDQTDNSRPSIICPEDDYDHGDYITEYDSLDLEKLKARPAHMGVFLRYIFSQAEADPNPLLFYLCAEVCQQQNARDAFALGKDIWITFLDKNAPLRVKIPEQLLNEIDSRLLCSEDIRGALSDAQEAMIPEIQEQIQDYRSKRTMGLGSLYGENDLLDLDSDPHREHDVALKQIEHLREILSKYEEERSSHMNFALRTYMSHAGISFREFPSPSVSEKSQSIPDKDKWLPFLNKAKKSSNAKKEKDRDSADDKKRNPILKYIAKPKTSQSIKPGNVRNIIQHFENNQYDLQEPLTMQRLSTGSFPEDLLDNDSARAEVKLGRSESLKGREELKKSRKADNVPRSRSDVDMDAAAEATRLHQSASSSASSLSTRSLDNPTPPFTPKLIRRSMESPNLNFTGESLLANLQEDDLGHLSDLDVEPDAQNWQHTVGREVAQHLSPKERARQEVIHELFMTEASHLRVLRVLDHIFYQRMRKDNLLSTDELSLVFPNLPELIEIHNSLAEVMKRVREEGPVVKEIGDLMLFRFDGPPGEEVREETAKFCSCQTIALDLIKTKKRKEARFNLFMQEAESSPQCRRLQLKDLIVSEMQRLTKYPLLLENIIKHTDASTLEYEKLCRCRDRCRDILKNVNESVKQRENGYRLAEYQKRLDTTSLERTSNPLAAEFKNLDLTTRRMIHEGSLTWRITKDKTIDLNVLLLEDLLVLLQKQDEKLVLKCHSKATVVSSDTKQTFSPVIKLNSVLVRPVATDKRAFFIICTSELGPQIYELVAMTSSEKNMWKELLEEATKTAMKNPSASIKRVTQGLVHTRMPSVGSVLQDTVGIRSNSEDISADDSHNDFLVHSHKPDVLLEEPEGMEEDEAQTPTQVPFPSNVEDTGGGAEDQSDPNYQWPSGVEGLADSALEDVQHLRELILRSLYPLRHSEYDAAPVTEPEDDITPTPSVTGGAGHPWETTPYSVLETLDGNSLADHREDPPSRPSSVLGNGRSVVDLTNQHRRTSNEGEESVWDLLESHPQRTSFLPSEPSEAAEDQTNTAYKVVRKAEVVGNNDVIPLPDSSQSDRVLQEAGGGTVLDGNLFYVVMPTVSALPPPEEERPRETQESRECIQPMGSPSLPKSREIHKIQACSSDTSSPPAQSSESDVLHSDLAPNLVIQDVDMIFQTIEQLTAKLQRLQEVESAHQELLRSLRRKPPEDVSQEPEPMEDDKQPEMHHGSSVHSNSLFFVKNSVSVSIHRDSLTDPHDNALNFPMGL
ncbi:PREDICTED: rho guanine nucleotide exchange factor 11 isoform X3 [Nanorana parkeri]|uniref:rho guanine nucleotide exchange factor 11 isoform X3 n=1 Tax=Nanorana parkeri TaxID=125878 RepID=UPI000854EE94|nr:PREDICTED: rho guanine nucleotide exchange factor 11 isoform X3 [Nanorana parkeri]